MNADLLPRARRMEPADLPAVLALDARCQGHPWTLGGFREEISRGEEGFPVVRPLADGAIAGYLCAWMVVDEMHLGTVGVDPALRRSGIGRDLVVRSLEWAASRGAAGAHLEVRASNSAAIALYESLGYHRVGIRRAYYPDNGEDAHLLFLSLSSGGCR